MVAEDSDDLLDGFEEERRDAPSPWSPERVLGMAQSETGFRRSFILMYVALAMPLISGVAAAVFSTLASSLTSLIPILIVNAPAMVWFISLDESKNYVPPRLKEFSSPAEAAARSRLHDIHWGSTIGMIATWILSNALITYAYLPPFLVPGHVTIGLIIASVMAGILSFFIPAILGFNALVRVFRASEDALTDGGVR